MWVLLIRWRGSGDFLYEFTGDVGVEADEIARVDDNKETRNWSRGWVPTAESAHL